MGKIKTIFLITIFLNNLFAKGFFLSSIPAPKTQIMDIDIKDYTKDELLNLLYNGKVFTFLSKASKYNDENIKEEYQLYVSLLNISSYNPYIQQINIAMLLPTKKIGKYAQSTIKSVISYLLAKNVKFRLKSFEIENEKYNDIQLAMIKIEDEGFDFIIAPLTLEGAKNISLISSFLKIYIPTINKNDIDFIENKNIIFGGIDYKKQIEKLLIFANKKMVIFYEDESPLAIKLNNIIKEKSDSLIKEIKIKDQATNLKRYFYKNKNLDDSTIFLNTPIIKSSLILSQLTLYDIKPLNILSTQINYNPLIFSLTQYKDRENLIIANSIYKNPNYLEEINSLLNNDISYNWINYSTSIGIDYFYSEKFKTDKEFHENVLNKQVIYNIFLVKALNGNFQNLLEEEFDTIF